MLFYQFRKNIADKIRFYIRNYKRAKDPSIQKTGFWIEDDINQYEFDQKLADSLSLIFINNTVVDFGCGSGAYVNYFIEKGIAAIGYDGNPFVEQLSGGTCYELDLSQEVTLNKTFDWVISLEVAEHIPRKFEAHYVNNLMRHCNKGIIISWAIPFQLGRGHVNLRNNYYVKNLFLSKGFVNNLTLENQLRESSTLSWFKNTLMVFEKIVS